MHLLNCPDCDASHTVSPAQAGGTLSCTSCGKLISVPQLGVLRQLPAVENAAGNRHQQRGGDASVASRALFIALGVIGLFSFLIAGFCSIRWGLIEVPKTTESHIAELRETYETLSAAELIREWEQMEEMGVETTMPQDYREAEIEKQGLMNKALLAAGVGGLAFLGAAAIAFLERKPRIETAGMQAGTA